MTIVTTVLNGLFKKTSPPAPRATESAAVEEAKAKLAAELQEARAAAPQPPSKKEYPETWDLAKTFHWSGRGKTSIPAGTARDKAERRVFEAIQALDNARATTTTARDEQVLNRGVAVWWLMDFAKRLDKSLTTAQVVENVVKAKTDGQRCRYVELDEVAGAVPKNRNYGPAVGRAEIFVSHTWGALFQDLLASILHVAAPTQYVWLDLFAVRQWPGNLQDLDFTSTVQNTKAFLLSAKHVPEVNGLNFYQARDKNVEIPKAAMQSCAFFRVWCVVELAAAAANEKPLIMLYGGADKKGNFRFEIGAEKLKYLIDIEKATASVQADIDRELVKVKGQEGGVLLVNDVARNAVDASCRTMRNQNTNWYLDNIEGKKPIRLADRAALQAAVGNMAALHKLDRKGMGVALVSASSGGHIDVVRELLDRGANERARGAARAAIASGKVEVVKLLIDRCGLNNMFHPSMIHKLLSMGTTNLKMVQYLIDELGADVNGGYKTECDGRRTPLMSAAEEGHAPVVKLLLERGADPNIFKTPKTFEGGKTALHFAVDMFGDLECVKLLVNAGADVTKVTTPTDREMKKWGKKQETAFQIAQRKQQTVHKDTRSYVDKANHYYTANRSDVIAYLKEVGGDVVKAEVQTIKRRWWFF